MVVWRSESLKFTYACKREEVVNSVHTSKELECSTYYFPFLMQPNTVTNNNFGCCLVRWEPAAWGSSPNDEKPVAPPWTQWDGRAGGGWGAGGGWAGSDQRFVWIVWQRQGVEQTWTAFVFVSLSRRKRNKWCAVFCFVFFPLACEDLRKMFDSSFPACSLSLFFCLFSSGD